MADSQQQKKPPSSPQQIYQWYEKGKGGWLPYHPKVNDKIERGFQSGNMTCSFFKTKNRQPPTHQIDFGNMEQKILATQQTVGVRRVVYLYRPWIRWEFQANDGEFLKHDPSNCCVFEKAYQAYMCDGGASSIRYFRPGCGDCYVLDFSLRTQRNQSSGNTRKVQRVDETELPLPGEEEKKEEKEGKKKELSYEKTCKICLEQEISTAVIPCGHSYMCFKCSNIKASKKTCAICRGEIQSILHLKPR